MTRKLYLCMYVLSVLTYLTVLQNTALWRRQRHCFVETPQDSSLQSFFFSQLLLCPRSDSSFQAFFAFLLNNTNLFRIFRHVMKSLQLIWKGNSASAQLADDLPYNPRRSGEPARQLTVSNDRLMTFRLPSSVVQSQHIETLSHRQHGRWRRLAHAVLHVSPEANYRCPAIDFGGGRGKKSVRHSNVRTCGDR